MKIPFSIKANITLEDYFTFSNYHQSRRRGLLISSTLILVLSLVNLYFDLKTKTFLYCIITTLVISGTLVLALLYVFNVQKQQFIQSYQEYIEECADKELSFTEENVFIQTPTSEITVKWSTFSKIEKKEELICLYNNKNQVHIIPKRSFDKKEDIPFFLNWVSKKLKQ